MTRDGVQLYITFITFGITPLPHPHFYKFIRNHQRALTYIATDEVGLQIAIVLSIVR